MRHVFLLATVAAVIGFAPAQAENPFAQRSSLPYQAPPFDKIQDGDYQPAIEQGIAESLAEVRAIADNPAAPTFDNTIVAMERQGQMLARAQAAFGQVAQANTNPTLQAAQAVLAPKLAAYGDTIFLDPKLFARVKSLYDRKASLKLDAEQAMLVEEYYTNFVRAGAQLSAADQTTLRDLNKQISMAGIAFRQRLLAGTKAGALVVDDPAKLAGMSAGEVQSAARDAAERKLPGKYLLPLQNTTGQPALEALSDRATRKALFDQSWTRTQKGDANDTRAAILQLIALRTRKANLLGYKTWADYSLAEQMAKTADTARGFLDALDAPTAAAQAAQVGELQQAIDAEKGGFKLEPWDWELYAEKVRKAKFDLDLNETKPYLEIWNVLENGIFYAANQLYGLTFKRRSDIPTYHPDIRVYEVFEENGKPLGLAYFDYWKRDNKSGGAWMNSFVRQAKIFGTKPVISNTANFTKPAAGQPGLVTFSDVRTMFHEFGHGLHGLFANQTYPTLSGTAVARDFVEFPSQFNEHWALEPRVLAHYAHHYQTGAAMPQALVDKIKRAETFNQGYSFGETLAAAQLDMAWHSVPATAVPSDVDAFEAKALGATGLDVAHVPPRYRSSYFAHIWGSGYAAGYYAYLWTDMIQQNVYDWFVQHGGMTRANGQRIRDLVLSRGHTEDYSVMFRAMTGHDPQVAPLLRKHGLDPKTP
ncbi:M3 family metallopeptidase [Sphingomonas sp. 10B4]|uniref:M3 family metallopeptidase n=1 Tax=Sphingomonas sp. 10B4 TaxID=3048575 RepID=UPI002AB5B03A|nr:M3 family metallopeptidase [Sphingomonas sp. 10B4]MDY7526065.1 M3 family metallopeptidase [Sphingomonas sp. 10B4]MEB0281013.1 M3 family metallopeptidase [Sphingomonas sp. 10B4]